MKCFATIALLVCVAVARCEPPPQSQYLPPHQQQQQQVQQPSSNYLPPAQSYQAPNSNYLPPQRSHSAPQSNYGAPAVTAAIFPKQGGGGGSGYGGSNNGYGRGDENNYGPAKYDFKYDVQDYESGNDFGHMESRDGDLTVGRYYVLLPDGRKQVVDYEADQNGYRPSISYEQTNSGINGGGRNAGGYANNGGGYDNNAQSNKFGGYQ